jgi:hypothetical protein
VRGTNNKHPSLTAVEDWKSRIKVPKDLVSGEVLFLAQMVVLMRTEQRALFSSSSYKGNNPTKRASTS